MFKYYGLLKDNVKFHKLSIQTKIKCFQRKQLHDWINTPAEKEPQTNGCFSKLLTMQHTHVIVDQIIETLTLFQYTSSHFIAKNVHFFLGIKFIHSINVYSLILSFPISFSHSFTHWCVRISFLLLFIHIDWM